MTWASAMRRASSGPALRIVAVIQQAYERAAKGGALLTTSVPGMAWWFAVVESKHEIQNPTSAEKIRLLGERLKLGPDSRVLDMGLGRGVPAVLLARSFGCRITCVEQSEEFVRAAKERIKQARVGALVELVHSDGKEFPVEADSYDSALCLGASFIWGGLTEAVAALAPGVRGGGFVAVGEPYWRRWPLPHEFEPQEGWDFVSL